MRTTVTLDPDVQRLLKDAEHRSGRPFKQILNDAVRAGLGRGAVKAPSRKAVSAVMARSPLIMPAIRLTGTSISLAKRFWLTPNGSRNSSNKISPG